MTEQEERDLIGRWWDDHVHSQRADFDEFYNDQSRPLGAEGPA